MSDAGESGDTKDSFVEDENKLDIKETSINLGCVKNELKEETHDFEQDCHAKRYKITLEYENLVGQPSHQIKIEEDSDNLIGFLDNDVIMEDAMIKLEAIKDEDDKTFNDIHCSKCMEIFKGYCLKCSSLLRILNNSAFVNSESKSNSIPTDILEIRETSQGKGVYLLRTLPINIIFGPFEGVLGIESTVGHCWKIIGNKLRNIKSGNWMKNIVCAASASLKNLDIFQIDGNLYFRTNREIAAGEELLIYYDDGELQQLDNSEECLYTPRKQEKLPEIFACTMCCLGFGSSKCLIEHKRKCQTEHSRSTKDFVLVQCHYCKMWLEKWEHDEYHVAYCLEKYHRMCNGYSGAVDQTDTDVEEMTDYCDSKDAKRTYQLDICSIQCDGRDDLQFDAKDYQCLSGGNDETRLNECPLADRSNNEQIQNAIETNDKSHVQNHLKKFGQKVQLNAHICDKDVTEIIKQFQCDICMTQFTQKGSLNVHIKNKHTDDGSAKEYRCLECFYQTNYKSNFQKHLNMHSGIKSFKCDICMKEFGRKWYLKQHIKKRHTYDGSAKDYKCTECPYQTNYKNSLQRHLNMHRGIKPFKCDICMMEFTDISNLSRHVKDKHGDNGSAKDYKCLECSYQTNAKHSLQNHLNKHRGIKPFKCDICLANFTQKGNLKTHIRNKHRDERADATNSKSHFQGHPNVHRGIKPFTCDICMMTFTRKGHLERHIKNKHYSNGIKQFKCDICAIKFTEKGNLTKHIKNKHTKD